MPSAVGRPSGCRIVSRHYEQCKQWCSSASVHLQMAGGVRMQMVDGAHLHVAGGVWLQIVGVRHISLYSLC